MTPLRALLDRPARLPGAAGLRRLLARFPADRRGVAALEFALIAPLLLCMYFATLEAAQGIETNKKVARAASMVGDLITQQQNTSKTDLDSIMQIAVTTLNPYTRSYPTIEVTAIQVSTDSTPKVTVVWSRKFTLDGAGNPVGSRGLAPGAVTTVPATLKVAGSFLIRSESTLPYKPVITWAAASKAPLGLTAVLDPINMKETYYMRPRVGSSVTCLDC